MSSPEGQVKLFGSFVCLQFRMWSQSQGVVNDQFKLGLGCITAEVIDLKVTLNISKQNLYELRGTVMRPETSLFKFRAMTPQVTNGFHLIPEGTTWLRNHLIPDMIMGRPDWYLSKLIGCLHWCAMYISMWS